MVYNEGIRMGAGGKPMSAKPVEQQEIVEKPKPVSAANGFFMDALKIHFYKRE